MDADPRQQITALLQAWSGGDEAALERLVPLVEGELRRIAQRCLKARRPEAALETTSLVNEAYARLIDLKQAGWRDRAHFFALCARIMRGILVDHVRALHRQKRGAGAPHLPVEELQVKLPDRSADVEAIDEAIRALSQIDPRKGQVVEMRFFGGLSVEETAQVLHVSPETVRRDWKVARIWLLRELSRNAAG